MVSIRRDTKALPMDASQMSGLRLVSKPMVAVGKLAKNS